MRLSNAILQLKEPKILEGSANSKAGTGNKMSREHLVVSVSDISRQRTKCLGHISGTQEPTCSHWPSRNTPCNKIHNIESHYNPKYKMHIHVAMLINISSWINKQMGRRHKPPYRRIPNNLYRYITFKLRFVVYFIF